MLFVLQPADVNFPHPATAPTNVLWSSVTSNTRRPGEICCSCIVAVVVYTGSTGYC